MEILSIRQILTMTFPRCSVCCIKSNIEQNRKSVLWTDLTETSNEVEILSFGQILTVTFAYMQCKELRMKIEQTKDKFCPFNRFISSELTQKQRQLSMGWRPPWGFKPSVYGDGVYHCYSDSRSATAQ